MSVENPSLEPTASLQDSKPDRGGETIGRYSLIEKLGEGGMGEVWVAKQSEPVKRRVALKLIKAGMDSKGVLQRFEQERQALALMDHPNIARVLDGGLTDDRRPYFVMELVNGLPLTRFCDEAKLGVKERLELFLPVCQAVQHAHQKGIIHRDLKPTNILVTLIDGKGVPKVIDFGVAKATSGRLTDESLSTQFGAVVGTLEYMSPEQAGFAGQDVDTRADIYSLGVILYELLTGLRPIDTARLRMAALDEMIRIIREEEPSKPSTRLSTHDSAPSLAALRLTEPKNLAALLRGELDWVVMKCLEKRRDRRYESASGLAREIQRYLAGEPVEARPASAGYRLRKLISRHRGEFVAAALVFLALLAGMAGTTIGLFRAEHQRSLAVAAQTEESRQRTIAEQNGLRAQANFKQARDAVDRMLTRVADQTFRDVPGLEPLRRRLLEDALEFHREFLREAEHDASVRYDAAWAYLSVAEISKELDALAAAEEACKSALELFERLLADSPTDSAARSSLASGLRLHAALSQAAGRESEVEGALRRAAGLDEQLTVEFPERIQYQRDLVLTYTELYKHLKDRKAESDPVLQKALALMEKLARSDNDRGALFAALNLYTRMFEFEAADPDRQIESCSRMIAALEGARSELSRGAVDDSLVTIRSFRGLALGKRDRTHEAEKDMRLALELGEKLAADFPSIPRYRETLAGVHDRQADLLVSRRRYAEAEEVYRKALVLRQRLISDNPANLEWRIAGAMTQVQLGLAVVGLQYGNPMAAIQFVFKAKSVESIQRSLDYLDQAVVAFQEVLRRDARNRLAREWLGQAYKWRGVVWQAWENPLAAAADFNLAIEHLAPKDRAPVSMMQWSLDRGDPRRERLVHAHRLASRGKHEEAAAAVESVAKEGLTGAESYDAACAASLCSAAARRDSRLSPALQKRLADQYEKTAFSLLRQAVARGFRDAAKMSRDSDLAVLRESDEFKKLIADLSVRLKSAVPK